MASRMEKYYNNADKLTKRSEKNQDLYREIYDAGEYSNIEAVATLEHTNEIDITKIKSMLKNREDYKKQKEYRSLLKTEEEEEVRERPKIETIETYDVKDALEKLKEEKKEDDEYRSLGNTNYNILKELQIKSENKKEEIEEEPDLKEEVNTISSTSLLNELDNEALSLNVLEDLASSGTTVVSNKSSIESLLEEAKALDKKAQEMTGEIDNSFYTSSLNFDKKDFEELYDEANTSRKTNIKIKIIVGLVLMVISVAVIVLVYKLTR